MRKKLQLFLRLFGIRQHMFIYKTKKSRSADIHMDIAEFVTWMVILIPDIAETNGITPLALASEIKKYIKDETRKENQDEDTTDRTQEHLSDIAGDHSNSDRS